MNPFNTEGSNTPSAPDAMGISLVLPAWNENETLPLAVSEADAALKAAVPQYEIIVVDDGSTDDTENCLQALTGKYPSLRVVRHEANKGYGAALRAGFACARCELVAFTDADLQFDLTEVERFVHLAKDYDIVCGYRIDRQDSALRCFYSRVYNALVRSLLGTTVRDIDCAFKVFRRAKLQELPVTTDGFLVNTELLTFARLQAHSIVEVGVTHRPRAGGESTVSVSHIPVVLASLLRFWWNRVQFPGDASQQTDSSGDSATNRPNQRLLMQQGFLLVLAGVLVLHGLNYPLIDRDETRYAEIPREMLVTGDWLVPRLNFETYYDKPPLLYWACATSYSLFGVSEWAARLVPAVCGLFTLTMTIAFGNRFFNRRVGLLAGTALLLSAGFLGGSRVLLIDGLLTCCVSLSLFSACEAVRHKKMALGWWLVASVAAGLGFLAKGPIAIVLFLPPFLAYAWLTGKAYWPRLAHWVLFVSVVAGVVAPWFVTVSQVAPDFAYQFFYRHNVERFGGAFHAKPFWFFLPVLLVGGFPWSLLSFHCLRHVASRADSARLRRPPQLGFLVLWALWCLAFFSASSCKLPMYILPAAPAMALIVGKYLEQLFASTSGLALSSYSARWAPWSATVTCIALAVGFVGFGAWKGCEPPIALLVAVCGGATLLLAFGLFRHHLDQPRPAWGACVAATLGLAILVLHREMPRYAAAETLLGPSSPLAERLASDSESELDVVTVGHEWSEVPYYLNRSDVKNFDRADQVNLARRDGSSGQMLIIARRAHELSELRRSLPSNARLVATAERDKGGFLLVDLNGHRRRVAAEGSDKTIAR